MVLAILTFLENIFCDRDIGATILNTLPLKKHELLYMLVKDSNVFCFLNVVVAKKAT